jgi:hypothetical protein
MTASNMSAWSEYLHLLQAVGIPLNTLGLDDIALARSDALAAVTLLANGLAPILGGDVYWRRGLDIEPAYANWHTSRHPDEGIKAQILNSCAQAAKYIENFPKRSDVEPLFSLVVRPQE